MNNTNTPRRVAQSFSPEEVQILDMLLRAALTGSDVKIITRRPAFKNLARKALVMRQRVEQLLPAEEESAE
jgi:hypothetical protein